MSEPSESSVSVAVLIASFLSPFEVTEIRGKLSGRTLPWDYQSFPLTMRKLRSTGLRFDWARLHYLPAGQKERSQNFGAKAGLGDDQIARLVIPIQTADKVVFETEDTPKRLPTAALCYVDNRRPAILVNAEPKLMAIHLMLDVYGSDQLRQLVRAAGAGIGNAAAATA